MIDFLFCSQAGDSAEDLPLRKDQPRIYPEPKSGVIGEALSFICPIERIWLKHKLLPVEELPNGMSSAREILLYK